jgi:menaquinone-9 beta-reductase
VAHPWDVLVVGGGPAGAAAGYWLARDGHRVLVVERKRFPREKTCGDGLTPRAVHQLEDMGLGAELTRYHRHRGLRACAHGLTLELDWPSHPTFPPYGYVVRRRDLDQMVAGRAEAAGATVRQGTEALAPRYDRGLLVGATVRDRAADRTDEIDARFVVVADGANSRFGRALGATRNRSLPQGMAIRGYYESPIHDDPWIESALDVRDRNGQALPGYGWIFPVGDGTVNVGIGLLSTYKAWKDVNTSHLMEEWAATAPARWGLRPEGSCGPPTGGRLPMAGSVGPKVGPSHVVVGDAAGSINPFNGEGIDYAYETARAAAGFLHQALVEGNGLALGRYQAWWTAEYGLYFKVARTFVRLIGHPALMRELTRVGMHSRSLMEWVLRIMANLLRPDELGPAEAAYRAVAALARTLPGDEV